MNHVSAHVAQSGSAPTVPTEGSAWPRPQQAPGRGAGEALGLGSQEKRAVREHRIPVPPPPDAAAATASPVGRVPRTVTPKRSVARPYSSLM